MNPYYQQRARQFTNEYGSYSVPLSPVTSNENQQESWMNDLIANSAPISQTTSNTDLSYMQQPANPINFSALFEEATVFSGTDDFSSSNDTSLANSPVTNPCFDAVSQNLNAANLKLEKQDKFNLESLETVFETKDILKDEPKLKKEPGVQETKPKRRAPRKKLTESQKKAHNKIEKRYRININAKIAGIQKIIPWVALEKTAFETGESIDAECEAKNNTKLNKSMILEKATEYIIYLQKREKDFVEENQMLKEQLAKLRSEA
ncbi:Carbohydrate metabolism regulator TYE7 [Candida viswanathii]|uniref:Carbohydrate metabolism regulator TYE7 n=1 Tax=Candida viswanathii TaxID=5486 RepID=A0A367YC64_9ASCO|nr:Carbohydrate metabolism regulator TYE7 [Candida viswanathii]